MLLESVCTIELRPLVLSHAMFVVMQGLLLPSLRPSVSVAIQAEEDQKLSGAYGRKGDEGVDGQSPLVHFNYKWTVSTFHINADG